MKSINSTMLELDTRNLFSYSYTMVLSKGQIAYREYLKSSHWKELKEDKISRSKNNNKLCCVYCSMPYKHVHHINYKKWYDVESKDLRLACEKCHTLIHKIEKKGLINYVGVDEMSDPAESKYGRQRYALLKYKYDIFFNAATLFNKCILTIIQSEDCWKRNSGKSLKNAQGSKLYKYAYSIREKQTKLF